MKPLLCVGWSLNYEMAFYLIILISILLFKSHSLKAASFFLSLVYAIGITTEHEITQSFFGNEIFFEFALGFAVFYIYKAGRFDEIPTIFLAMTVAASYFFLASTEAAEAMTSSRLFRFGIPAFFLTAAFILLEKRLPKNNQILKLLESLGNASYATYLTHWYVIVAIRKIAGEKLQLIDPYSASGALISIIAALIVGQITYNLIDRPLSRQVKSRLSTLIRM